MYCLHIPLIRRTLCIVAALVSSGIIYAQQKNNAVLKGVNRIIVSPMSKALPDEGFMEYRDTVSIFFRNDTVMYRIAYRYIPEPYKTNQSPLRKLNAQIRYQYFAYKEGNKTGVWLGGEPVIPRARPNNVQAFLLEYGNGYEEPLEMLIEDEPTLVSKKESSEETILKYIPKKENNKPSFDTVILTLSDRFSDIPYHYSIKADKFYKKRVIGLRLKMGTGKTAASPTHQLFLELAGYLSPILPHQLEEAKKYLELAARMKQ